MTFATRALVVLVGLVSAVLVAASALLLILFVGGEVNAHSLPHELRLLPVVSFVTGVVALPFAIPVIIFHEVKNRGPWQWFLVAGALIGFVIGAVLGSESSLAFWKVTLLCVLSSMSGAMAYWFVAWNRFPPEQAASF